MSMTFDQACAAVCAPGTMFNIVETEVDGQVTKSFELAPPNLTALFGLAAARTDEFIIYEDERWTMPEVLAMAGRIGDALVNTWGVTKGDRVALAARNYPDWIASFVAVVSVGAVVVPLNAWWTTDELDFAIEDSGAKVVLADAERARRIMEAPNPSATIVVMRAGQDDLVPATELLDDALNVDATMPIVDIEPDDLVSILYTSGTTGRPKGAASTHGALVQSLMAFAARTQVAALMEPGLVPDPEGPPSIVMLCVPLFHVTGLVPVMLGSFIGGAQLVMTHRWDPDRALELIERERVTSFIGVPTMSWDLLEARTFAERDTSSLRTVGGGGAPMPPELVQRIEDHFPNGRPGIGYGMTETNAYGPQNVGSSYVANPTSVGRAVPIMDLRVTDPDGNVLGAGETGELWFKSPTLICEYWNRPEATAETIVDGWLRTGDIGHLDTEGNIYVSDRAKDMVLRGGENIYCSEVEAAIYEHPAVYETAVYGVSHERLGEELGAHVMLKPGQSLDSDELAAFLAERLAGFKVPTVWTFVAESLPRNASGKIVKRALRDSVSS